jgi:tripartite-type tricarboxylate transporter receptor subunit TctC
VALATTGQAARTIFPNVPEVKEYYPDFGFEVWFALFASGGTPDAVIQRLNAAVAKASQSGAVKQKLLDLGVFTSHSTPAEVTVAIQADSRKYAPLIKTLGLKVD